MRIAMLASPPNETHGWGRYTRDVIIALAALGTQVVLITSGDAPETPDLPLASYHRVLPSLIHAPRLMSLRLLAAIPTVQRLTADCDLIHVTAEPYVLAVPPTRRLIVTAHGTYVPQTATRPLIGLLYRSAYRRAKIICVSSYTQKQVQAAIPDADTTVILNGVDASRYQQQGELPEKSAPTILAVGQVKARKGFHILAKAMRRIREAVPDAEAIFIGDTSDNNYYLSVQAQLQADGLTNAVHWLGHAPESIKLGWYQAADVFALPAVNIDGRFEGFGLVFLEASAAGLPVVGTLDCGAEDVIRDGETGFLTAQNDPDATADAIIRLLKDPVLRSRMGIAGAAYAAKHGWENNARRVLEVYQSL
jgi:phosphatidylinositol alpha-1,6-mannosyltransferase